MSGVVYHTGDLASDRATDSALDAIAAGLLKRAEAGKVNLAQRRAGPGRFEYVVIERPRQ